ncbi:MAG: signal peptide peptidase SppA [Alphaproteobacteria bacterium]|nr:signal peptide peptidase SppA [Alphaproteobacteria bacterium]
MALGLETDLILDRRRLKRRLVFWRVLGVLAVALLALALLRPGGAVGRHVARVNVTGIITDDRKQLDAINALARDGSVAAVIVSIDSPGGSVSGSEALYDTLSRVAAKKPVVAVMRGTAASAGYMAALPATRIFAREGTLTGSIGVLLETPEIGGLLAKLGIDPIVLKSGPLKDQPSLTAPLTPEGKAYLQGLVNDLFDQFVGRVATARHLDPARVRELADGRAYTGRQALALGLVDQYGGEPEARDWLASERRVPTSLPVRDVRSGSFLDRTMDSAATGLSHALLDILTARPSALALWPGVSPQ